MKKILRDNKGSISALVVISVLLYSIVLTTVFMQASSKRKIQMDSQILAKEAYEKQLDNLDEIRDEINGGGINLNDLQIGDYVNYAYDSASSYNLESKYSGYSNDQEITQTIGLKWRILNIDKTNRTIDVVSEIPTTGTIYFGNILGYNNGPYLMNEICKAQYSNKTLGINARNINLLDMEKQMTKIGINARNIYQYSSDRAIYGKTKTYTGSQYYPTFYKKQIGEGTETTEVTQPDTTKGNDPYKESEKIADTEPTTDSSYGTASSNGLTVTQTYYKIQIDNDNYGDAANVLASNTYFWIAARCIYTRYSDAFFGLRVATTYMSGYNMYLSYNGTDSKNYALRPIVSIPTSLLTGEKDSTDAWNLK